MDHINETGTAMGSLIWWVCDFHTEPRDHIPEALFEVEFLGVLESAGQDMFADAEGVLLQLLSSELTEQIGVRALWAAVARWSTDSDDDWEQLVLLAWQDCLTSGDLRILSRVLLYCLDETLEAAWAMAAAVSAALQALQDVLDNAVPERIDDHLDRASAQLRSLVTQWSQRTF